MSSVERQTKKSFAEFYLICLVLIDDGMSTQVLIFDVSICSTDREVIFFFCNNLFYNKS